MMHAVSRLTRAAVILFFILLLTAGCTGVPLQASAPPQAAAPTPTAAPAIAPTPTPTATPTATPSPTPVPPPGDAAYDAFFDESAFVGDSITQGLRNYVYRERLTRPTLLGSAQFFATAKYGLQHAASTSKAFLYYQGRSYPLPDLLTEVGAKKVFIMLGLNNWAGTQIDNCIALYRTAVENMRLASPEIQIYIQSCTPVVKVGQWKEVNNENIDAFNAALQLLCEELDVFYVDISTPLKDENNALPAAFSSDKYVHMSPAGAAAWVDALYQYAYDASLAAADADREP